MGDPRHSPTTKGVIEISSQKVDNDHSEGWIETFVYEENGQFFRVTHHDLTFTGHFTNDRQDDWSTPEEITKEQYETYERARRR